MNRCAMLVLLGIDCSACLLTCFGRRNSKRLLAFFFLCRSVLLLPFFFLLILMSAQSIPSELILHILKYLTQPADLLSTALCCKSWSLHALELLWYKPNIVRPSAWLNFCDILHQAKPTTFPYTQFIRRINLSLLASDVDDRHLACLDVCERLERITLANCSKLTDEGLLAFLGNKERRTLVSIDLSDCIQVTDKTITHIAQLCPNLQGLNLSMCKETEQAFVGVTDDSIVMLARRCPGLRRVKHLLALLRNDFLSKIVV